MSDTSLLYRASRGAAAALVFAIGLAACGSDSSSSDGNGDTTTTAAPSGPTTTAPLVAEGGGTNTDGPIGGDLVPEGTLRLARTLTWPPSYNPHFDQDAPNLGLFNWVFEGLVRQDANGQYVPHLAKSWEFSDDVMTLTFQLHEGITFSDGAPFNAETAKQSLDFVKTAPADQVLPTVAAQLDNIESIEATGEYELTLNLVAPRAIETIIWLAKNSGLIVSPNALGEAATNPIGTGPFILNLDESSVDRTSVVLDHNPNYWIPGVIGFERVEMDTIADVSSHRQAFETGQYDIAVNNRTLDAPVRPHTLSEASGMRAHFVIVDWNGEQIPELANRDVRCAIAHTVNREGLRAQLNYPAERMLTQWANNPTSYAWIEDYESPVFDLEKAQELLDQSGESTFSFETRTFPGGVANQVTAWSGALGEIGITLTGSVLDPPSGAQMFQNFSEGVYPIQWIPFEQSHPLLALQQIGMPDGGLNASDRAPEGFVELVEAAQEKTHEEAEAEIEAALKIMYEECIWFPLYENLGGFLSGEGIEGVVHAEGLPQTFYPQGVHRVSE